VLAVEVTNGKILVEMVLAINHEDDIGDQFDKENKFLNLLLGC
jgi:hypothetical protein